MIGWRSKYSGYSYEAELIASARPAPIYLAYF